MNGNDGNHDLIRELQPLCEAAIECRLTANEQARLEELVLQNQVAKTFYTRYLHLHGCLHWSAAEPADLPEPRTIARQPLGAHRVAPAWWNRQVAWVVALAAVLVWGVWWRAPDPAHRTPPSIATLMAGKTCKWDSGSLPTEVGARLGPGRLRLAEGLASLVFDSGAEVRLEAPAELELVSARRCILHSGRLVAQVPPPAIGFIVDTPTAVLTDYGTDFGVFVQETGTADVQVFSGRVDGAHRATQHVERVIAGQNVRFTAEKVSPFDPLAEKARTPVVSDDEQAGARVVQIATALGEGKDGYIQPIHDEKKYSPTLLLVKNSAVEHSNYFRKAYMTFDISSLERGRMRDARLMLTFAPTGLGFASEVPDATFAVFGLLDEADDHWREADLRWENAPANHPGGNRVDPAKTVRLGTFEIAQGLLSGTRVVGGPELVDFLQRDTNQLVTLILVRETPGSGRADLVHGFASKRHPRLPPPTLKITLTLKPP